MIVDARMITDAFDRLATCRLEVFEAEDQLDRLKRERESKLAQLVVGGLYDTCKNEDQRRAAAKDVLRDEDDKIVELESALREGVFNLSLTRDTVEMLKMLQIIDTNPLKE